MTKGILHFEDLAFTTYSPQIIEVVSALFHNLQGENIGQLSLKIDGSPCVVFGRDVEGYAFVSTKSFFNKTPILYRTQEEILNSKKPDRVKRILMNLLVYVDTLKIMHGMTLAGDYLFHYSDLIDDHSFQQNIIKYFSKTSMRRWHFGIALHKKIFCGTEIPLTGDETLPGIYVPKMFTHQQPQNPNTGILFDKLMDLSFGSDIDPKVAKAWIQAVNKHVRENDNYDDLIFRRRASLNNFFVLDDLKKDILEMLNENAKAYHQFGLMPYINGQESTHEGWVFKYRDYTVKLVDRFKFSKLNQDESTERGWSLTES